MRYISTRDINKKSVTSMEAIKKGIASDGGLYVPIETPKYLPNNWKEVNYYELANDIFSLYLTELSSSEIEEIVSNAYDNKFPSEITPCVTVGNLEILELFHGPTAAFKDIALQALPRLLSKAMEKSDNDNEAIILVATSGDTGKAALEGFKDVPGCRIIVFYPKGGVSTIQEHQMLTTGGNNTFVVSVDGNFDDCQTEVKHIFGDESFNDTLEASGMELTSANSINFGRLLPQIIYYYYGYGQMVKKNIIGAGEEIQVVIPTGNFGNILAAYYAKKMGVPIGKLVCASNKNSVLTEAINKGKYNRVRPFFKTISPSMDILISSNFERFLFDMYEGNTEICKSKFEELSNDGEFQVSEETKEKWSSFLKAGTADDITTYKTIKQVFNRYGYLLDPHTAVGWNVLEQQKSKLPTLLVSTASPYKFPEAVLKALGHDITNYNEMELIDYLAKMTNVPVPENLMGLNELTEHHDMHTSKVKMKEIISEILLT
ncbi:MAG: threonine synthase [Candidatus Cloacimonas sp.]|nr:threonine synthase [Candidatus Cloacimonas sp.]